MELMEQQNLTDEKLYRKARKQVGKIRGFYMHLSAYCIVIPILIFINLKYSPEYYWFFFSMLGWGIGLAFHAMEVFGSPFFSKEWEARKIKELLEKENRKQHKDNN